MFPIGLIWEVFQSSLSCILAIFHLTSPPIFPLHKGDFLLNLMRFPDTAPAHETGSSRWPGNSCHSLPLQGHCTNFMCTRFSYLICNVVPESFSLQLQHRVLTILKYIRWCHIFRECQAFNSGISSWLILLALGFICITLYNINLQYPSFLQVNSQRTLALQWWIVSLGFQILLMFKVSAWSGILKLQ